DFHVTGVQTCALPISNPRSSSRSRPGAPPRSPRWSACRGHGNHRPSGRRSTTSSVRIDVMGLSVSQKNAFPWEKPSKFSRPGAGWAEVGASLTRVAAEVDGRHHGSPLPAGDPATVLAAVADALGPEQIPAAGIGEDAALGHL